MARAARVLYAARPVRTARSILIAFAALVASAAGAAGCAPQIGDGCSTSTNCSINGDRLCDTSQPGGNCTVFDCQADVCPDNAVCVRFNPLPARRAIVACMKSCGSDVDCRSGEGYRCRSVAELASEELTVEVLDLEPPDARFCVAVGVE